MRPAVGPGSDPKTRATFKRDRKEDSAGARRVGRRHRRHHQVGQRDRVAKAKRAAAEAPDDGVGDPLAEARLGESTREQEGGHDHPDRDVRESGEGVLDREQPQQHAAVR